MYLNLQHKKSIVLILIEAMEIYWNQLENCCWSNSHPLNTLIWNFLLLYTRHVIQSILSMQNCLRSAEALELMMMPHGSVGKWLLQHTRVEWPIHWRTLNLPPSLHPQLGLLLTAYTLLQVLWRREIKMYNKLNFDELYKWYIFVSCSLGTVVMVINF